MVPLNDSGTGLDDPRLDQDNSTITEGMLELYMSLEQKLNVKKNKTNTVSTKIVIDERECHFDIN